MVWLVLILVAAFGAGEKAFVKAFQKNVEDEKLRDSSFFILTIIVACTLFAILSGFDLRLNMITALFSLSLAFFAFAISIVILRAYAYTDMVSISVSVSGGGIVIPALYGITFLNEEINIKIVLGMIFAVFAVLVPYFFGKSDKKMRSHLGTHIFWY